MKLRIFLITVLPILLSFVSCSSAPPPKEEVFDKRNLAAQYMEFGNRYYQDSDYPQALQLYLIARNYFGSLDDTEGLISAYNALGKTYLKLGEQEEAYNHFQKALEFGKVAGKREFILQTVNNLSEAYLLKGDFEKALSLLDEYLSVASTSPPWKIEDAVYFHNRGTALNGLGRLDEAKENAEQSVTINLALKNYTEAASNYYLLSSIHAKKGNLTDAVSFAELALKFDKQMENSNGIAQDLLALGLLAERMERTEKSYDFYSRAFLVYRSLNDRAGMRRVLKRLEEMAEKLGKDADVKLYREAREALESSSPSN
ncbi:MAG TPA: tetratricopeptide repeat protein [Spirochaetales bacterium]|nr:tetratricopeptide repeat protein [Spirochaetales bacterium]